MIPPEVNLVGITLKMFLAEIIKNAMFYMIKFSVEKFCRIVAITVPEGIEGHSIYSSIGKFK